MNKHEDDNAERELRETSKSVHFVVPTVFIAVLLATTLPFQYGGATRPLLNRVSGAAFFVSLVTSFAIALWRIRRECRDDRVVLQLRLISLAPYAFGMMAMYFSRRFDSPFVDPLSLEPTPFSLTFLGEFIWYFLPALFRACSGIAVVMVSGGTFLRWVLDGDFRARIAGQWIGLCGGVLLATTLAEHSYVSRVESRGGMSFTRQQELLDEAEKCLSSRGQLSRMSDDCVSLDLDRDCETADLVEACEFAAAKRYVASIYRIRVRRAAWADAEVISNEDGVYDLWSDCRLQGAALIKIDPPIEESICAGFAASQNSLSFTYNDCVYDCSDPGKLLMVAECTRACVGKQLTWLPEWAFTYESKWESLALERNKRTHSLSNYPDGNFSP